jgi:hypothetical protein
VTVRNPISAVAHRMRQAGRDIAEGRGLEAYATFALGLTLAALDLADVVDTHIVLAALLVTVSFLAFHIGAGQRTDGSAGPRESAALAAVLRDRTAFTFLPDLLTGVRDLRIYGPTAINVLAHTGEIERAVLSRGGTVRIVVQRLDPVQLGHIATQLDAGLDLEKTLRASYAALRRLAVRPGFDHRLLAFSPGFSMIIVDPDEPHGFAIVELHGFADDSVNDRMHMRISKAAAPHWFRYWTGRFEAIWLAARPDEADPPGGDAEENQVPDNKGWVG